jgi:hypothetical protein
MSGKSASPRSGEKKFSVFAHFDNFPSLNIKLIGARLKTAWEVFMGAFSSLTRGADGEISLSRTLFLIWSTVVFIGWLLVSLSKSELASIPPSLVTILGLLAGGEASRDYLYWKIKRTE